MKQVRISRARTKSPRASLAALALFVSAAGCFSPRVPTGDDATGESSGSSTSELPTTSNGDSSGPQESETTSAVPGTSSGDVENGAPSVDLTIEGDNEPSAVLAHGLRTLTASVSDDGEVVQVEFFQDGEPIGEASAPPYELEIALTSLETGSRTYSAVATDDVGNTGDDELSLSVNIVGGVTEKTNDTLFLGGFHDAEASAYAGGGLVARDGEVFLAGSDANDEGVILETDEELVVQWERRIGDGFRSRPALGDGARVVVAGPNSGDWEVHILDTGDGSSIDSIALGPVASVGAGLGPQLATYGNRLDVNENPTDVLRLDLLDGSQVALFEPGDVVTNITTALDTGTSFVAYGFDVGIATTPCANAARTCVASIAEDNSINWEAGLTDDAPGVPRLAPAPRDGVFAATDVYVEGPGSFRLFHISSTGEVLAERLLGEEALDTANEAGDRVMALAAHQGGGVVVCGALGPPVAGLGDTGLTPEPFVALYDRDLELVWESRDMIPPEVGGAYALGCATTALDVFVFGVRGQGIADDQNPIVEGQIWLARLGL